MKRYNLNKKGFTLIELLAVIVVLAIIMLIATTQVVPLITSAREDGFASTANTIVSTTQTVVMTDEITNTYYDCYDVEYLLDEKYLENISSGTYEGYVLVNRSDSSYTITLHDKKNDYYIIEYNYTEKGVATRTAINEGTTTELSCADISAYYPVSDN